MESLQLPLVSAEELDRAAAFDKTVASYLQRLGTISTFMRDGTGVKIAAGALPEDCPARAYASFAYRIERMTFTFDGICSDTYRRNRETGALECETRIFEAETDAEYTQVGEPLVRELTVGDEEFIASLPNRIAPYRSWPEPLQ